MEITVGPRNGCGHWIIICVCRLCDFCHGANFGDLNLDQAGFLMVEFEGFVCVLEIDSPELLQDFLVQVWCFVSQRSSRWLEAGLEALGSSQFGRGNLPSPFGNMCSSPSHIITKVFQILATIFCNYHLDTLSHRTNPQLNTCAA